MQFVFYHNYFRGSRSPVFNFSDPRATIKEGTLVNRGIYDAMEQINSIPPALWRPSI